MKINIIERMADIEEDQINITIEAAKLNPYKEDIVNHIKQYHKNGNNRVTVYDGNIVKSLEYKDILLFFSKNKDNYCRTSEKTYKIKSKLYELEDINMSFVRISKNCIINTDHLECFDKNIKGKIVARLDDKTEEIVSRRRIRTISKFIEERRI